MLNHKSRTVCVGHHVMRELHVSIVRVYMIQVSILECLLILRPSYMYAVVRKKFVETQLIAL